MIAELIAWSKFIRDSFDKILLFVLTIALVLLVLHMSHDKLDEEQVSWAREITGTVLGGLLGLITGRAMAAASKKEDSDGQAQKP
jgi:hypothetical protein